jgi:cytochrome c-type biogenesis protein CcmE
MSDNKQDAPEQVAESLEAAPAKKSSSRLPLIFTSIVVAIVALTFLSGISGGRYSLQISEIVSNPAKYANKDIKVVGRIRDAQITDHGITEFTIHDDAGKTLRVSYSHNLPDPFKEGRQCIVEGRLDKDNIIQCSKLTVKCPSKYQSENDLEGSAAPENKGAGGY